MKIVIDQLDRDRIISSLDENVIVMAGAGTGKTTLLIGRLLELIFVKQIPVEKIVALTFTRKAAEELRERLEDRLRDIVENPVKYGDPEKVIKLAEKALFDIPKSQIGTIHGFAGHLLRLYPLQAGVDPSFREDEGDGFHLLFESLWKEWLYVELGENAPRQEQWFKMLNEMGMDDIKLFAKNMASFSDDMSDSLKASEFKNIFIPIFSQLKELKNRMGLPKKSSGFSERFELIEKTLSQLINEGKFTKDSVEQISNLSDYVPKEWQEDEDAPIVYKKALRLLKKALLVNDKIFYELNDLLTPFINQVRKKLSQQGIIPFDSILMFTRNLLRDHLLVREALKKQYVTFLIDEFQDTDPLQGEILFYLAEVKGKSALNWRQVQLEPGRLFVVGDPKQSIYRFRGADIAAFEDFWNLMRDQGAYEAILKANFRSEPQIISAVNQIFSIGMVESSLIQPKYEELTSHLDGTLETACEIFYLQSQSDSSLSASQQREVEADAMARWIHEWVGKKCGERILEYRDIAFLLRGSHAFFPYLEAFRRYGIPYLTEGEKTFYQRPEVTEMFNLLSAILNPEDTLALVGVMRSPLGGFTDAEIFELKKSNSLDYRRKSIVLKEKTGFLFEALKELNECCLDDPLGDFIEKVFARLPVLEINFKRHDGDQSIANVLKIKRMAMDWLEKESLTLKEFVERLRDHREDEREEGENPLADAQFNAVKIMTIHKAKGLEFPVVFLPNLSASLASSKQIKPQKIFDWRTQKLGVRLPSSGMINSSMLILEEELEMKEKAEEVRVFYVALTRAKNKLMLGLKEKSRGIPPYVSILKGGKFWPHESKDFLLKDQSCITVQILEEKRPKPFKKSKDLFEINHALSPSSLAEKMSKRESDFEKLLVKKLIISPSFKMSESDSKLDDSAMFFYGNENRVSPEQSILIGHICHKVLEKWDFQILKAVHEVLKKHIYQAAHYFDFNPDNKEYESVVDECFAILGGFLNSAKYKELTKVKILAREVPFMYALEPIKEDSSLTMRGVMDLVYEDNNKIFILDYKTNQLKGKKLSEILTHYQPQAKIYKTAIKKILNQEAEFEILFLRESSCHLLN
ncbi:MAG: UvrD-helicase domain-containing protein [Elusimicrobiota bacterium]